MSKIAVKVGRKASKIRLTNVEAFRAIDIDNLFYYVEKNDDCNIVIIESIAIAEEEAMRNFISEFKSRGEDNKILFFITDVEDTVTSGLADEVAAEIIMSNDELQRILYEKFKINSSTSLELNKTIAKDNNSDSSLDELMGDIEGSDLEIEDTSDENNIDIDAIFDDNIDDKTDGLENIENLLQSSDNDDNANKIKDAVENLKKDYLSIVQKYNTLKEDKARLEEVIVALDKEKNDIINRFKNILINEEVNEDPISLEEYKAMQEEMGNKDIIISGLTEKREKLEEEIASLKDEMINKEEIINNLKEKNKEAESTNKKIKLEQKSIIDEEVGKKDKEINDINNQLIEVQEKLNNEMESNDRLSDEIKDKEKQITELEEAINKLTKTNKEINSKLAKKDNLIKEKESQLNRAKNSKDSSDKVIQAKYETKVNELETQLKVTKEQLESLEEQYNNAIMSSSSGAGADELLETNKNLQNITKSLREELGKTQSENIKLKREAKQKDNKISSLNQQIKGLNETLGGSPISSGNIGSISSVDMSNMEIENIAYNGNAIIMSVFGGNSCGITTTAMSLAYKLSNSSRVLFIDFDLVNPMADAWFKVNPMCNNVLGIPKKDYRMSGLGIFFEIGSEKIKTDYSTIRKVVVNNKNGILDYLSGAYYNVPDDKVAYANYTELFSILGSLYDYIIIDLGKIGTNKIHNAIINNIIKISNNIVIVSEKDYFSIRSIKNRLNECKIGIQNAVWLLNLCLNTNIDANTKKLLGLNKYHMIMIDTNMIANRQTFIKNRNMRENFEVFYNNTLF